VSRAVMGVRCGNRGSCHIVSGSPPHGKSAVSGATPRSCSTRQKQGVSTRVWPGSGLPPVAQVFNLCLSIAAARGYPRSLATGPLHQEAQPRKPRGLCMVRRSGLPVPRRRSPDFPPPCGLTANTNFSWRDLMLQNPSPPLLHPLSRASSLLRGDPTSPPASSPRRCLLGPYRLRTGGDLLG